MKQLLWAALFAAACSAETSPLESDVGGAGDEGSNGSSGGAGSKKDGGAGSKKDGSSPLASNEFDEGTCEVHEVGSRKATPDMLIVLDRSGSMAANGNPNRTDRWTGSVQAVLEVTREFSSQINFGLMTFPAVMANTMPPPPATDPITGIINTVLGGVASIGQACAAGTVNVEIGKNKAGDIATALGGIMPGGATPTAASLEAAQMVLGSGRQQGDTVVPPKYVLLLTDGDPNCSNDFMMQAGRGGGGGGVDMSARTQTIAAIENLRDDGIQTYVVGYQTAGTNFAQQLDMMATAGGTGDNMHRSVASPMDLRKTFTEIAGRALSCSFKLDKPVDNASFVRVTVNGKSVKFDSADDGWTLGQDKQTVTLTGAACDTVQAGAVFNVSVECDEVFVQ